MVDGYTKDGADLQFATKLELAGVTPGQGGLLFRVDGTMLQYRATATSPWQNLYDLGSNSGGGGTGPAGTITEVTVVGIAAGSTPYVELGGTPSARTIKLFLPAGARGATGLSAYQTWLGLGNTGTEAQFIESLRGPAGGGSGVPVTIRYWDKTAKAWPARNSDTTKPDMAISTHDVAATIPTGQLVGDMFIPHPDSVYA